MLLESSNAETWTPINVSDLTMCIYGYEFAASCEVRFLQVAGVQSPEMNLDEYSAVPQGTSMSWDYSADDGATWDEVVPAEEERMPGVATRVLIRAKFAGCSGNDSPALNFGDVNLVGYLNNAEGIYMMDSAMVIKLTLFFTLGATAPVG